MGKAKIAITVEEEALNRLDRLVREGRYPSRSSAIEEAVIAMMARNERARLGRECAKLDRDVEKSLAEEAMGYEEAEWPEY